MAELWSSVMPQGAGGSKDSGAPSPWEQTDLLSFVASLEQAPPAPQPVEPPAPAPQPQPQAEPELEPEPEPELQPEPEPVDAGPPPGLPRRLLILDTETTGLDPEQDRCIEVGAVLFDVPLRSVLSQISFLLPCERNPARAVNGIEPDLTQQPQPWQQALQCFEALLEAADLVVAHNVAFDRQWFGREPLPAIAKPWLCSMEDVRWPADRQLRATPSVRDLALAYGVPVWAAHRALTDCIYLAQVFERCDDLEQLLEQGLEPRRLYRARVSYDERHKAREAGFRWNEPITGAWSRRLSEREVGLLTFPVVAVDEPLQSRTA